MIHVSEMGKLSVGEPKARSGRIEVMKIFLQDMATRGRGALDVVVIKSCLFIIQRECDS